MYKVHETTNYILWENCCFISLIPCKYLADSLYEGTTLVPEIIGEPVILSTRQRTHWHT